MPAGHAFFHGEEPKDELKPGMVISIGNCGLYLGDFGVRVEDTVAVTDRNYEELTHTARERCSRTDWELPHGMNSVIVEDLGPRRLDGLVICHLTCVRLLCH